jgi:hypothetical protein
MSRSFIIQKYLHDKSQIRNKKYKNLISTHFKACCLVDRHKSRLISSTDCSVDRTQVPSVSVIPYKLQDNLDALKVLDRFCCSQLTPHNNCVNAAASSVAL